LRDGSRLSDEEKWKHFRKELSLEGVSSGDLHDHKVGLTQTTDGLEGNKLLTVR